jgi:hypothetical protein
MKNTIKSLLVLAVLMIAVNVSAQDVYTYPSATLTTTTASASAYMTYPSSLKLNYAAYATFNVDTLTYVDSMLVIHQTQISIDNVTWFDYGVADTLIEYSDVAEKDEDYLYTSTPWVYMRDKFTQNDSCSSIITGYLTLKKQY